MASLQLAGAVVTLVGALFLFLGALGVVRMPDAYNRIQAGTKASTLGVVLALVGLGLYQPDWLAKLLVIAVFVLVTNPVSAHALARAAHRAGLPLCEGSVGDALAEAKAAAVVCPPAAASAEETPPAEETPKEETVS